MEQKKDILKKIIKEKAVLKGDFVLSSGQKSNIYIDIKMVSGEGEFLDMVSDIICDIAQKIGLYNFAGVELGGVPLVAAAVMKMHQRGFKSQGIIVRKKSKRLRHIKNNRRSKINKSNTFRRCNNNRKNNIERNRKTQRKWY
jgi:orotate phosphoribosyltransferase